jgi:hypothetical protein
VVLVRAACHTGGKRNELLIRGYDVLHCAIDQNGVIFCTRRPALNDISRTRRSNKIFINEPAAIVQYFIFSNSNCDGRSDQSGAEPGFEYRGAIDKTNWTTDK